MTRVENSIAGSGAGSADDQRGRRPDEQRSIRDRDHPHYKWIVLTNTTIGRRARTAADWFGRL